MIASNRVLTEERRRRICCRNYKRTIWMSQIVYDHVCDPVSLMQDSFSLSEFILGHPDNDSDSHFFIDNLEVKKELDSDIEDQQIQQFVSTLGSPTMPTFAPVSYMYSSPVAMSPASYSSNSPVSSPSSQVPTENYMRFGLQQSIAKRGAHAALPYNSFYEPYSHKRRRRDEECSPEEKEKRRIRRERNKLAALRCRTRRRDRIDALEQETAEIEAQNDNVETEIKGLKDQIEELQTMLKEHDCSASNKHQHRPALFSSEFIKVKTERISFDSDQD